MLDSSKRSHREEEDARTKHISLQARLNSVMRPARVHSKVRKGSGGPSRCGSTLQDSVLLAPVDSLLSHIW